MCLSLYMNSTVNPAAMTTPFHGIVFRVTEPVYGDPPATDWFPSQIVSNMGFDVFFDVSVNKRWGKQSSTGDLRRHDGHRDVNVMPGCGYSIWCNCVQYQTCWWCTLELVFTERLYRSRQNFRKTIINLSGTLLTISWIKWRCIM